MSAVLVWLACVEPTKSPSEHKLQHSKRETRYSICKRFYGLWGKVCFAMPTWY